MLSENEITLVVTSAISRYALENNGKRELTREDVIDGVVSFGGDVNGCQAGYGRRRETF